MDSETSKITEKEFIEFVKTYQERLYLVIYRMVQDVSTAQDLLQDTLLAGYNKIEQFQGKSGLYTYFYRIAVNKAISHLRMSRWRHWTPLELIENWLPHGEADSLEMMIEDEDIQQVKKAMQKLPPRQKAIFVSRVYEGLSFKEIAGILKISESAARSNFFQAVQRIKREVP